MLLLLENYAAFVDRDITVVFDARRGKADTEQISARVTVLFASPRYSADQVIERMVRGSAIAPGTVVVTSDRVERLIVMGAGIATMSAQLFVEELLDAQQELSGLTAKKEAGIPSGRHGGKRRQKSGPATVRRR